MPDPTSIDPSMLSDEDRARFLQNDEQRNAEETEDGGITARQQERTLKVPEGKFASPETRRAGKIIGHINILGAGRYEFFIPADSLEPDGLDLIMLDEDGNELNCVKLLLDYDDNSGRYEYKFFPNENLPDEFYINGNLEEIVDRYKQEVSHSVNHYVSKRVERSNNHLIRTQHYNHNGEQKDFEQIHQQRGGDCILATTLNTLSFNENGHLPFTTTDLRKTAILLRGDRNKGAADIQQPDSPLDKEDFIYLLANLTARKPRQENIITINGLNRPDNQISLDIIDVLDKLADSDYQTLAIGTSEHARALRYFGDTGDYVLIDPLKRGGIQKKTPEEIIGFLTNECRGAEADNNMFYIV